MSEETEAESGTESNRESPGRILKAAREKKGLSIEKLAGETLLSADTLTALEADDFERLSQAVFVRGYYRKCAKVLDLPEDDLLSAYVAHAGPEKPLPANPEQLSVIPQDVTPHSWRGLGLILAVLALLLALLGVWWLMPTGSDGDYAAQDDLLTDAGHMIPAIPEDSGGGVAEEPAPAEEIEETVEPPPAAETTESPPVADDANESGTQLRLRFNQRSWVEVRDAGGTRLLEDVPPAGSERVVSGRPPYEVMLGNAPGVEILFDGEPVVFDDRIRGDNTARLRVAKGAAE